ncbi:MAG TPA: MYXO-CTERM sorting domain-containing protein, partial [Polyangiaceae bacterium]|nr:MYXO-CTERM sorting domain-containing protein [Polyangiaceae bacterium]
CTAVSGSTHGGRAACQGAGPCGATCDGSSRDSCEFPGATTSCGPAFCANGARSDGQLCDGAGTCTQGQVEQCLSQTCDGTACGTSCETDADCTGENRCRDGVCEPDPLIDAVDEGSCGCRVPGRPADGGLLLLAGLFASSLLARRRQRASVSRS